MIQGQTCDPSGCVIYEETVSPKGQGPDSLFESFPAALLASAPAAPSAETQDGHGDSAQDFDWEPYFDNFTHADARLKVETDGERVRARIEVAVEDTWHLYHGPTQADLGSEGPVAAPTVFEYGGDMVEWLAEWCTPSRTWGWAATTWASPCR